MDTNFEFKIISFQKHNVIMGRVGNIEWTKMSASSGNSEDGPYENWEKDASFRVISFTNSVDKKVGHKPVLNHDTVQAVCDSGTNAMSNCLSRPLENEDDRAKGDSTETSDAELWCFLWFAPE